MKADAQITFLPSSDLAASRAFYVGILGFDLAVDQGTCHIYGVTGEAFVGVCRRDEVSPPEPSATKIWQMVCSGLRKEVQAEQRVVLRLGHTRLAAMVGKVLSKSARIDGPRLRWRPATKPYFRNQVGTLEIAGGEVGVRVERVWGGWRNPRLETVIEHKLY